MKIAIFAFVAFVTFIQASNALTNNDSEQFHPLAYFNTNKDIFIYVESDGQHITAFEPSGKILWCRTPLTELKIKRRWFTKMGIIQILGIHDPHFDILLRTNSSQNICLDSETGDSRDCGQD
jgi:hypothetical protein